jgi:hypothetical protein
MIRGQDLRIVALLAAIVSCNSVLGIPEVTHGADGGRSEGGTCPIGQKSCAGACASTSDPAAGCGGSSCDPCTFPHASPVCVNGECALSECELGWAHCSQTASDGCEVQVASDAKNCGRCDLVCPGALQCVRSGCLCKNGSDCGINGGCNNGACVCNNVQCSDGVPCNAAGNCAF